MYRLPKIMMAIAFILIAYACQAVTRTAVSSGSFSTAARWSPNGAPGAGDSLIIPAGITVTSNQNGQTCYALVVYGTFNAPKNNFNVTNIYNYGTITSDGNNFQSAGKIVNSGTMDINGNNFTVNNLTNTGTMTFDGGSPTITGTVVNTGTITGANLPIELLYFKVESVGHNNIIAWATATEQNNDYFTIERSIDAINFYKICTVKGAGSSNAINRYEYADPYSDAYVYYRLSQTDFDGATEYFDIVSHKTHVEYAYLSIGGNRIMVNKEENASYTIEIYDMSGKVIISRAIIELDNIVLNEDLVRGIYIMKLITPSRTYSRTFFIE